MLRQTTARCADRNVLRGSIYKKVEVGLIQSISQLLEIISCFIQAALTKILEEGYLGGVGLDDHSEDDRNCLKIQGPQLLKMKMVSPNASGLSCASHFVANQCL